MSFSHCGNANVCEYGIVARTFKRKNQMQSNIFHTKVLQNLYLTFELHKNEKWQQIWRTSGDKLWCWRKF